MEEPTVSDCSEPGASMRSSRETVLRTFLAISEALLVGIDESSVECDPVSQTRGAILRLMGETVLV
jgi:hypothetical protein